MELAALADQAVAERVAAQTAQIPQAQLILAVAAGQADVILANLTARRAALASLLSVTLGRKFIPAAL